MAVSCWSCPLSLVCAIPSASCLDHCMVPAAQLAPCNVANVYEEQKVPVNMIRSVVVKN